LQQEFWESREQFSYNSKLHGITFHVIFARDKHSRERRGKKGQKNKVPNRIPN
jgi:hypothetical protein